MTENRFNSDFSGFLSHSPSPRDSEPEVAQSTLKKMETRFENNQSMEVLFSTEQPDDSSF